VGSLTSIRGEALAIGHDAGGVYAMTLVCTHQGCDMSQQGSVSAKGIFCAYHGSQFSAVGAVESGPARAALQHFAVSADAAGNLTVHQGTTVDPSTRLRV
jgi:Rieske Fe-S protein